MQKLRQSSEDKEWKYAKTTEKYRRKEPDQ